MKMIRKIVLLFVLTGAFAAEDLEKASITATIHAMVRAKHRDWEFVETIPIDGADTQRFRTFRWNTGNAKGAYCGMHMRILKSPMDAEQFLHGPSGLGCMSIGPKKSLAIGDEAYLFQSEPVQGLPEPGCTIMFRRGNVFVAPDAEKLAVGDGFSKELDDVLQKEKSKNANQTP